MSAVTESPAGPADGVLLRRTLSPGRRLRSQAVIVLSYLSLVIAVVPLVLVLTTVVGKGGGLISPSFLTDDLPIQARNANGGIGPAVVGTLVITGLAALLAVPLGILAAVYL
ncbi:MAG: phosphate ABC transporter permease PstA, partial [Acidimicrobiales bacterium]